jgi:phospho-N-acetylmuramoyl-pentapeptide-transferase
MDFSVLMPVIISFAICVILCPIMIPFLRRLKFGQQVRTDGPKSHEKKTGTPTMGGIIILLSVTITSVIYIGKQKDMIPVLFATVGFGLIGFFDDYLKIVMQSTTGLKPWQKLFGQIFVTGIFAYYLRNYTDIGTTMLIPFTGGFLGGKYLDTTYFYIPLLFLVMLGTVNGANFTDGLDGLASSVTLLIATFFSIVAIGIHSGISYITLAATGSLLGFLLFNVYPARVFMGDTGSLALGGFVATSAYMLRMPLFILIVGLIYLIEVLSVILQVGYFKLSGGKRIFKMAPIHHHFELSGWPETKVVAVFGILTAILCLIALMGL